MDIKVVHGSLAEAECDVLVVNLFQGVTNPGGATGAVDKALGGLIKEFVIDKDKFEGKFGQTYILQTYGKIPASKVLLVGLGEYKEFDLTHVRELSSKVAKKCESILKAKKVCSVLFGAGVAGLDPKKCACSVAEGVLLGAYKFDKYKSKKNDEGIDQFHIVEIDEDVAFIGQKGLEQGKLIAEATNFARNLGNEPAAYATPSKLAEIALDIKGIETNVIEFEDAKKMGMGAYCAVAQGSEEDAKFIHMAYKPKKPKKKIAIIGKGVTFDSGGMNLKPSASMRDMKGDMCGAAAVLGIMNNITKLKPEMEIHAIIAATENMISGGAYKPGDVLTAMNGKTIEVDNTDAEGRLTLADALCYAVDLKVDEVVDMATLTGACAVALGQEAAAIMGNDQELVDELIQSAEKSGERFWQMPIYKEHTEAIKSDVADMKNTGSRYGGTMSAAALLKEFVGDTKWAHIDIAGCAMIDKEIRGISKGATGAGVRALMYYLGE